MMMRQLNGLRRPLAAMTIAATLLSACGGGGEGSSNRATRVDREPVAPNVIGGVIGSDLAITSTSAAQDSSLRYVAVTREVFGSNGNTGALDHDGAAITGGLLGGSLNGARTQVDLTAGGVANLDNPDSLSFVRIFGFERSDFKRFGVVGVQTDPSVLPITGATTYRGTVNINAAKPDEIYVLNGDATITANWGGAPNVRSDFTNLTGTLNDMTTSGAGTLTITGAALSDGVFTGGNASGTGAAFSGVSSSSNLSGTRGEFFGPNGEEVGGVVAILGPNDLEITGVYTADGR